MVVQPADRHHLHEEILVLPSVRAVRQVGVVLEQRAEELRRQENRLTRDPTRLHVRRQET